MPLGNCHYYHFGLIVTGKGEREFLPHLFKGVMQSGVCNFEVIARVGQRRPITSPRRIAKMVGSNQELPPKDFDEIGIPARQYISAKPCSYVLLVDDIEYDHFPALQEVFNRYKNALNSGLGPNAGRASVHFLVMMLEAYYFADNSALNSELETLMEPFEGDVETKIRHPKNDLKNLYKGFDEIEHGKKIIQSLNMTTVLGDPSTCAFLRAAYAWCHKAIGLDPGPRFALDRGTIAIVTGRQMAEL